MILQLHWTCCHRLTEFLFQVKGHEKKLVFFPSSQTLKMQFSSFRTFGIGKLMLFTCYLSSIELMSQANWIFIFRKRAWKETFVYTISSKNGNSALLRLFICLNQCGLHRVIDIQPFPMLCKIYKHISLTHMLS